MWIFDLNLTLRKGFSLLEIMLAIVVLGIGLTVFFSAVNQGVFFAVTAQDYHMYRKIHNELNLLEPLDIEDLEEGDSSGSLRFRDSGTWRWQRVISAVEDEEDGLFHLRTQVWREGDRPEDGESTETFIYQPDALAGGWIQEPYDEF